MDTNRFQRWVVKIGSSLVCAPEGSTPDTPHAARTARLTGGAPLPAHGGLNPSRLAAVAADIAVLRARGAAVVVVSSGSVAAGRARLGLSAAPRTLDVKQACAAAGQAGLMRAWEEALGAQGIVAAQALLTQEDATARRRWLNARATLQRLLAYGACPVVNENDTVATAGLRYGDNDRLAALVAQMIGADVLVLLSDVDGLYDRDPRSDPDARLIPLVRAITPEIEAMAGDAGSSVGTGGMRSKVEAARIATAAGCAVVITRGDASHPIRQLDQDARATWFAPSLSPEAARKQWIRNHLAPRGVVRVDSGAADALNRGKSLLPAGVSDVSGHFEKGDAVQVVGPDGDEIARGLVTYGGEDARRIAGARSDSIAVLLGYEGPAVLIHRNDLVMTAPQQSS